LRVRAKAGDEVQIWPPWAERARLFVESVPVRAEEDLRGADFPGVERLWLLALYRSPRNGVQEARDALRARGATAGEPVRFGSLELEPWDLHGPKLLYSTFVNHEQHEVDYVSRACRLFQRTPVSMKLFAPGGVLHLRAGIVGERAYDTSRGPIRIEVRLEGALLGELTVPPTVPPAPGWRKLDVPAPPGDHTYEISVSANDKDRPLCFAAWVTDR